MREVDVVLGEVLAVVGQDHDDGPVDLTRGPERVEQHSHVMIQVRDASRVLLHGKLQVANVLPLEMDDNRILIATSQPTEVTIADAIRFHTGRRVEMVVARPQQIKEAIEEHYPYGETSFGSSAKKR